MPKLLLREPKGRAQSPHLCPDSFSSHLRSPRQDWGGVGGSGGKAIPSTRVGGIAPATQDPRKLCLSQEGLGLMQHLWDASRWQGPRLSFAPG